MDVSPAEYAWAGLSQDAILEKVKEASMVNASDPAPKPSRRAGCYGTTKALILGQRKQKEIRAITRQLEKDQYRRNKRATCMPAVQALAAYRGYKKLFGERLHASKYFSKTPNKGFLDLPGELRNRIYAIVLVLEKSIDFLPITAQNTNKAPGRAQRYAFERFKKLLPILRFLRLCRQVNQEASDIYYGTNEFRFTGACGAYFLRAFMRTIGSANTSCLRKITLPIHWSGYSTDSNDMYGEWKPAHTGVQLNAYGLQRNEDAPAPRPLVDCLRMLERAGNLTDLTLVLPHAFHVTSVTDLGLDYTKFNLEKFKIKVLHLRRYSTESMDPTQKPLQQLLRLRRYKRRAVARVEAEWEDVEAYAEANGWGYGSVEYDRKGRYSA